MTDRSIESELKDVYKKLDDIEKKQEMMKKLYDLEREQQQKMGKRPLNHVHEMTWYNTYKIKSYFDYDRGNHY